ncbi:hemagglutinin repeat-containing protein [Pantoea agglomerans]|uniref:hemagglutinin repeat-containing protein n=1 Tax=Enterobacter agglomerans TaxID=549 RepID=UPI00244D0535|nr:hemagglutinin repeat-containing protein [Pantoea agglomerans]MDH1168533.1 hemagglutinin repeat-containing protein [Pantoea agglomerans]
MNKLCYRLIFNRVRGMLMVVSDITRSGYSRVARSPKRTSYAEARVRISPLSFALWLAAGVVSLPVQANIVADSSAPGSQQPTVMATANGLPQINIQTPNSQGVSRNQYSQLDVDARGAILNNSHQNTATQLGGMVAANPWLSKQEATVILNEVNSRNPSQLNGFIEVAGKRAAVVIANPSGITCNGCGFINASRNTLTTGQALIENGQLKGFDVNGGRINIEGQGLNDSDADYTQIIAQSVAVNAKVHARELNVVTGRNQVATEGNVTTVKADNGTTRPEFALDVASIGGMYAHKITLTGTEKGVGVRNAGELGASAGELHLTVDGRLENSGTLQSQAALQIASTGDQENRGNIVSQQDVTLASSGTLRNSGLVSAGRNATLSASTIESTAESSLAAGVGGNETLSQPGNLLLTSQGELKARGKNLAHDQIQARGSRVDLAGSQTSADAIALTSTQADISTQGATVAGRTLGIQAATALNNDDGKLAAGSLAVAAQNISNNRGLLRQQNREALTISTGSLLNNQGTLSNEGDTRLQAQHIENRSGLISGNGDLLQLDTPWLDNQGGTVQLAGNNGALNLNATRLEGNQGNLLSAGALTLSGDRLDLSQAHTQAESLTLTAGTLDHRQGLLSQRGAGEMAIAVSGDTDNRGGRIESGGNLHFASGSLDNSGGTLLAAGSGDLQLDVQETLTNAQGSLQASHNLQLTSASLNNQQGLIASTGGDATLMTREAIDNTQGRIEAGQQVTLRSQALDNQRGTLLGHGVTIDTQQGELNNTGGNLVARTDLSISSGTTDNHTGLIQSGGDLALDTHGQALINHDSGKAGIISGGALSLNSGDLDNQNGVIAAASAANISSGLLTNIDGTLMSDGALTLKTGALDNQRGLLQSGQALSLDTHGAKLNNNASGDRGGIVARGDLQLSTGKLAGDHGVIQGQNLVIDTQGQAADFRSALLSARGELLLSSGALDNSGGRLQSGGDMQLNTHGEVLNNTASGGVIAGANLHISSGDLDNSTGSLVSAGAMRLTSGGLNNVDGIINADHGLTLESSSVDNQRGLLQSGEALSVNTQGGELNNRDSGERGGIVAGGDLLLSSGQINGRSGVMLGQNIRIDTHQQTFDHQQGQLGAKGTLQLDSGLLNNRAGRIESGGDLQLDTHGNSLINRESGAAGGLFSAGMLKLYSGALDNLRGFITGHSGAQVVTGDINNQSGTLTGGKGRLDLTSGELQNQGGLLQAGSDMTLDTQGHALINRDSGDQRGIVALNSLDLRSGAIDNQTGFIAAGQQASLNASELNNSQGQVAGNGGLTFNGQALNNSDGKLQSAGDITLTTAGQTLTNQRGLIAGAGNLNIESGALDNQQGQIQGGSDLTLNAGQNALLNQAGKLLSAGTLSLTAGQLNNSDGVVQSVGNGTLSLSQQLDNRSGIIQGGQQMTITTPSLINRDTRQSGKGIEAGSLTIETGTLDNSQGALRAKQRLALTVQQALDNVSGLISSADTLIIQDAAQGQALAINNQQGTLIADKEAQINAASLSGDGQVLSQGNLGITLAGDFHNLSEVKANGTLRLTAGGNVTNDGTLAAQQALFLTAQNISNQANGEISGGQTEITAADTLNNRGLIDGGLTHLVAGVLNNSGTGRIYGDHIAIAATLLNNLSEAGKAAVIAARQRLDIAAGTLNNRDHALIYSDGDLHIGGQLDTNNQATGQGQQLNNDGATIEAGQDAAISMAEINNTNRHLTTQVVTTEDSQHHDAVLKGHTDRFDWADVDTSKKNKYGVHTAKMPDGTSGSEFYEYDYRRIVKETQIKESDPGKILSGGNMTFSAGRLNNHDSQIVAGAVLGGQIGELNNQATKGTRVTTDDGKSVRWYAKKKKKKLGGTKTSQGKDKKNYRPAPVTETIDLQTLSWQANAAPQGNGYQTGNRQQQGVTAQADRIGTPALQQAVAAIALSATDSGSALLPAGLRYDSALTLDKLGSLKDRPLLLPAGQQFSLTLPATVVDGQTITPVIRAVSPDIRLPDNSLYQLQPGSDSHYLVETDPRFVNQKQWLSSDYMQNALTTDSSRILKRLGDGYYEQRLVRDQIIQLTGNRYISGYGSDEDQYRGLMNNGVAFGKAYELELGVALTPAQMALLTSDIVWLVNQTVTLPDGTQQTVLVPQVYAKVKQGDLTGDGALIGGGSVALNARNDITNSGTIKGRDVTQLTAQSLNNSGYISGNTVSLTARQDITNLGGVISGDKQVSLLAGRDITSQSTLRGDGTDRWIDRPAGIYVQGTDGALTLSALNNITLAASDIGNAGEKSTTKIQAGNDLTLGTLSTQHTENDSWNSSNYRHLSQQSDAGTRITAGGALQLSAGQDIRATAADVTAGGALTASAGRDIVLSAGNSRTDLTEHSRQSSKGLLSGSSLETHDELHSSEALSTTLSGDSVRLQAGRDIAVTGSNVAGTQDVALTAGNDLNLNSATTSLNDLKGKRETHSTGLDRTTLTSGGDLALQAGRDLNSQAAGIAADKDVTLQAGRDVNLLAAETGSGNSYKSGKKVEINESVRQQGTEIASGGSTTVKAGQDVNSEAAQVTASGNIAVGAGRDINLTTATESDYAYKEETKTKKGFLSKKTTHTISEDSDTRENGTLLSGDNVTLNAGNNLLVQGSQVVGDGTVALRAGNNVDIVAATNTDSTWRFSETKKSGLMGTGGIGITVGSSKSVHDLRDKGTTQSQSASTVGSTGGNVSIVAGGQAHVSGSDLVAGRDLSITGDSVIIDPGHDKRTHDELFEQKKSGLTLALSGVVGEAINNAVAAAQTSKKESDGRLAALQATKAALSGVQAVLGGQLAEASADPNNGLGVSLSLTTQKSKSQQHQASDSVAGSTLNAGKNLSITSAGKGRGEHSGDILIAGSQLKAAGDSSLNAARDIVLSGAANTQESSGKNSSSGGGVGISFGAGQGSAGISIFASVNGAKGKESGNGTRWSETTLDSGGRVSLNSGRDTTLNGAQVSGNQVTADVGRDLTITSQQDSDRYDSKQTSYGAGGSFTFGSMSVSGYASVNQDKMHSNFDSVQEQSGIYAGNGGFDITVGNHTQLNGAVIASQGDAADNRLDTGTLGFTDIGNAADYRVSHSGGSIALSSGGGMGAQMLSSVASNAASTLLSGLNNNGHAEGTTQSAVANGTVIIRDRVNQKQDVADLSRDTEHANDSISAIFDKEEEQKRLQTAQLAGEISGQMTNIVTTMGDIKGLEKAQSAKNAETLPAGATEKQRGEWLEKMRDSPEYQAEMKQWGIGSTSQKVAQTVGSILTGLVTGNAGQAVAGGLNPWAAQLIKKETTDASGNVDVATNAMAHAVWGAVSSQMSGGSAATGAAGAFSGELATRYIAEKYWGADTPEKIAALGQEDREQLSLLGTLAAGLAGGMVGNSSAAATSGAVAGKNAVENNFLGATSSGKLDKAVEKIKNGDKSLAAANELLKLENADKRSDALVSKFTKDPSQMNSTERAELAGYLRVYAAEMEKEYGAAVSQELVKGMLSGQDYIKRNPDSEAMSKAQTIMNTWGYHKSNASIGDAPLIFGGSVLGTTIKEGMALNAAIGVGVNTGVQLTGKDPFSYVDAIMAGVTAAATTGKGIGASAGINMGGAAIGSGIKGENPTNSMVGAGAGTIIGGVGGEVIKGAVSKLGKDTVSDLTGAVIGGYISEKSGNAVKDTLDKKDNANVKK